MNKKQLAVLWTSVLLLTHTVWFPEFWFGSIVEGLPYLQPLSPAFLIKVVLPVVAITALLLYTLRSKERGAGTHSVHRRVKASALFSFPSLSFVLLGAIVGLTAGYILPQRQAHLDKEDTQKEVETHGSPYRQFIEFSKSQESHRIVERFLSWATENEARKVAILFNGDSAYYSETNHLLTEELARRDIRVVFSDTYRPGDIDFNISLSLMEAYGPDTVFFLGSYNERKEFVKVVTTWPDEFWKERLERIKWME
jgi:hypothetical protein